MSNVRKIIHIDMDAFFASVEQRDNPDLRGLPLAVGGSPDGRGVVAAASYEARRFGVHSAMSAHQAKKLCPSLTFVSPQIAKYREVSQVVMDILRQYSDFVEPLSLDEAYLDVTANKQELPSATETAIAIRKEIFARTQLTASAGVAPNKFLAKIASDLQKPDGLSVIRPEKVAEVLQTLPVRKVLGIGVVTEKKMAALGIRTTADLQGFSEAALVQLFGKLGRWYFQISRGIDDRPVTPDRERKSVSVEDTFSEDTSDLSWMEEKLGVLAESLARRLMNISVKGRTLTLKVTYSDFGKCTRSKTLVHPVQEPSTLHETAVALLHGTEAGTRAIRLLGIGVSNLEPEVQTPGVASSRSGWQQLAFPFSGSGQIMELI